MTALSQPAAETGGGARQAPPAPQAGVPQPGVLNVANALTVLRLLLVPVFVVLLLAGGTGWRVAALAVFLIASVTDLLDGRIARQRGLITDFGKIADPIADKALTGSALVTLSALGELAWWVTAVILARELGVTALRFWVIRHGVIAASRGGKIKTLLQVLAIALYIAARAARYRAGGGDGAGRRGRPWSPGPTTRSGPCGCAAACPRRPGEPWRRRPGGGQVNPWRPRPELGGRRVASGDAAAELIALLTARQQSIAVAESLTGGLLAGGAHRHPGRLGGLPGRRGGLRDRAQGRRCSGWTAACWTPTGPCPPRWPGPWPRGCAAGSAPPSAPPPPVSPARTRPRENPQARCTSRPAPGEQTRVRRLALSGGREAIRAATVARSAGVGPCHRAGRDPMITVLR